MDNVLRNLTEVARLAGFPEPKSIPEILAAIIGTALGFVGIIFLCLIIYSGFRWMTSGGKEEVILKAKDTLKNSIIGLIIVLSAYAITRFVIGALVETTGFQG